MMIKSFGYCSIKNTYYSFIIFKLTSMSLSFFLNNSDIPVGLLNLIPLGFAKHLVKYIVYSIDSNTLKMSAHIDAVVPGG